MTRAYSFSKKKSPAQLDREIAEALRGTRHASKAKSSRKSPKRGHATRKKKANGRSAILMVANDAALSNQYERAAKLIAQGASRNIATAFTTVTPESAEAGDYAARGWEDKEGEDIEVDALDIEEAVEKGSHAPVTDAIVDKVVRWLRDHGASSTSSSSFSPGTWYETEFQVESYGTGEEKQEEFFLRNFTEPEERLIFETFNRGRRG